MINPKNFSWRYSAQDLNETTVTFLRKIELKRIIAQVGLLIAVAVLAGCNTAPPLAPPSLPLSPPLDAHSYSEDPKGGDLYNLDMPAAGRIDFQFLDERPDRLKKSWWWEEDVGYEFFAFYGDDSFSPSVASIFKSYLAANLNPELSGKTVKLIHLSVVARAEDVRKKCEEKHPKNPNVCYGNGNLIGAIVAPIVAVVAGAFEPIVVTVNIRNSVDEKEFAKSCSDQFWGWLSDDNMQLLISTCLQQIGGDIKIAYAR